MRYWMGFIVLAFTLVGCGEDRRGSRGVILVQPAEGTDEETDTEDTDEETQAETETSGEESVVEVQPGADSEDVPDEENSGDTSVAADISSSAGERDETDDESDAAEESELEMDSGVEDEPEEMEFLPSGLTSRDIIQSVEGENLVRRYVIHAPDVIDPLKKYPVIFYFHGNGGEAEEGVGWVGPLVEKNEVVGIYPAGVEKSWNMGKEISNADDVAFVGLILDELKGMTNLNMELTYAVGYSNGAALTHKLATEANYFLGITSMASVLLEEALVDGELPGTATSVGVLQIHGTADPDCPYEGGAGVFGHVFLSVEESAAAWAAVNGCQVSAEEETTPEGNLKLSYTNCIGMGVISYGIEGVGHEIPKETEGGLADLFWSFFESLQGSAQ